jgi:ribosome-binding protein aMBF1 (putative translation factor)
LISSFVPWCLGGKNAVKSSRLGFELGMFGWRLTNPVSRIFRKTADDSPSPRRRVALLGIAQRSITVKFSQKLRKQKQDKPLPDGTNTLGGWIKVKRIEKNLSVYHLAGKMGIATALVRSWEDSTIQPDTRQLEILASLLGFDPEKFEGFDYGYAPKI